MRALITGFEPFGRYRENPSEVVVRSLPGIVAREMPEVELATAILPVSFARAREQLIDLLSRMEPDIYIGVGLRPGATHVAVERVAVNLADARSPDNDGVRPVDEPIDPRGPAAYFSTLPVKAIVKRMREEGIPAAVSNSAGTFLCNYVMYLALRYSSEHGNPARSGFVHVPFSHHQVNAVGADWAGIPPSLSIDSITKGVLIALRVTVERFDAGDERVAL